MRIGTPRTVTSGKSIIPWYRRRFAVAGALLATVCVVYLAHLALYPDEKLSKLTHIDVSALQRGSFMSLDTENFRYFVIFPRASELYVVAAPIRAGAVPMPEGFWWKSLMSCKEFTLDTQTEVVDDQARFRCRDAGQPAKWAPRWQWDSLGRHIPADDQKVDNLHRVRFMRDGQKLIVVGFADD